MVVVVLLDVVDVNVVEVVVEEEEEEEEDDELELELEVEIEVEVELVEVEGVTRTSCCPGRWAALARGRRTKKEKTVRMPATLGERNSIV